ncbi:MAG: helix-turn-helix domain-containing protein, partial [Thermomicrobiales bacterium]
FVNDLRLERAALLLRTTTQEITEIAAECGFDSLSYFYRLFGRRFGASPRAFRVHARRAVVPERPEEDTGRRATCALSVT